MSTLWVLDWAVHRSVRAGFGNDFFTQVATGAARKLAGSGYQLIIAPALDGEGDQHVLDALVDRQVDGIIAISLDVSLASLEKLAEYVPMFWSDATRPQL